MAASGPDINPPMTPVFRKDLITWYGAHARALPWRSNPTPYRVWVSEVMLQQTRVEAVREYFSRFMKRFPSLRKLASAELDDVLELWSGLGYYRRARMLHAAARQIAQRHKGRFPKDRAGVLALPGVGDYTAGAILSIAFNRPEPIVDGNVERVFARVTRLPDNVKSGRGRRRIRHLAVEHVTRAHEEGHAPSAVNQALMELGATVCTPKSPDCGACPVRSHCAGFEHGDAIGFPVLPRRARLKDRRYLFVAVRDAPGRVLMVKRDADDKTSLLPNGLWELPHVEWTNGRAPMAKLRKLAGVEFQPAGKPVAARHTIMNYRLTLEARPATLNGQAREGVDARWCSPDTASRLPIASATRKLLEKLA